MASAAGVTRAQGENAVEVRNETAGRRNCGEKMMERGRGRNGKADVGGARQGEGVPDPYIRSSTDGSAAEDNRVREGECWWR